MTARLALTGADVHDGARLHRGAALIVSPDGSAEIAVAGDIPLTSVRRDLGGGVILPGFVDLQVNGGGGVMFNDAPCLDTLRQIAAAHHSLGVDRFLPTLITDTAAKVVAAIDATAAAIAEGVPGVAGLHLEGPHLSPARKGAHAAELIRPMEAADLHLYLDAAARLPTLMITVAPEKVKPQQITTLAEAGVVVSLGHSDAVFETAMDAFAAGAKAVTHLFNAMSPLGSRAPGLVGAALCQGAASVGLIADGVHVHPATMRAALATKAGPGGIFLVSDAMATAGSDIDSFELNGRTVTRSANRLTLADGTLAGAHLPLSRALSVLVNDVGIPLEEAIAMATTIPEALLTGSAPPSLHINGLIHIDASLSNPRWISDFAQP